VFAKLQFTKLFQLITVVFKNLKFYFTVTPSSPGFNFFCSFLKALDMLRLIFQVAGYNESIFRKSVKH